jgi:hypothetical protein
MCLVHHRARLRRSFDYGTNRCLEDVVLLASHAGMLFGRGDSRSRSARYSALSLQAEQSMLRSGMEG